MELKLVRLRIGGLVSHWASRLLTPIPRSDIVHAGNIHEWHWRTNVVTIYDYVALTKPEEYGWAGRLWKLFHRRIPNMDGILTISDTIRRETLNRFPEVEPERVITTPLGIDHDTYYPDQDATFAILTPGRHFLLIVGEARPRKRTKQVIQAAAKLGIPVHRAGPNKNWIPYESECRALAHKLGVSYVEHGYCTGTELRELYNQARLVAYPSLEEGFGLVALEAAACGTPTLVGAHAASREVMGDKAYYAPTEGSITTHLQEAWKSDSITSKELIHHAHQFTWDQTVQDTLTAYQKIHEMNQP